MLLIEDMTRRDVAGTSLTALALRRGSQGPFHFVSKFEDIEGGGGGGGKGQRREPGTPDKGMELSLTKSYTLAAQVVTLTYSNLTCC